MNMIRDTVDIGVLLSRITNLVSAGRTGAARPLLAAARRMSPPSADISMLVAQLAVQDGDPDQAMQEIDAAILLEPAHPGLRKVRAQLRQTQGDIDGAARDAAEAVFLDIRDPEARAILGVTMLDLGRVADAVACLTEAVEASPAAIFYRRALATALEKSGDADQALHVLAEGIAISPASVPLRNAAILLCMRRRDFSQVVLLAEQARVIGAADASTFGMKGHALASLGEHEQAAIAYQEALKLEPNDPYVRHLVMAAGGMPGATRAAPEYVRAVFDGYADRFDAHVVGLGYSTPAHVRVALLTHPRIAAGVPLGPVLDLGCGTGLIALAISDLPLGPITGIDLSPRMLEQAAAKHLYSDLREADVLTELTTNNTQQWPMIIATDVLCYFGALEEVLAAVHRRLQPGGWFVFSTEEIQPDHTGTLPGNGLWALHRLGRYAHAPDYVYDAACAAGFRVVRVDRHIMRQEAGADVPGVLLCLERLPDAS